MAFQPQTFSLSCGNLRLFHTGSAAIIEDAETKLHAGGRAKKTSATLNPLCTSSVLICSLVHLSPPAPIYNVHLAASHMNMTCGVWPAALTH